MHVCDTWSFSAISRVVLWRSESIIALIKSSSTSTEIRNYLVANPIYNNKSCFSISERRPTWTTKKSLVRFYRDRTLLKFAPFVFPPNFPYFFPSFFRRRRGSCKLRCVKDTRKVVQFSYELKRQLGRRNTDEFLSPVEKIFARFPSLKLSARRKLQFPWLQKRTSSYTFLTPFEKGVVDFF